MPPDISHSPGLVRTSFGAKFDDRVSTTIYAATSSGSIGTTAPAYELILEARDDKTTTIVDDFKPGSSDSKIKKQEFVLPDVPKPSLCARARPINSRHMPAVWKSG